MYECCYHYDALDEQYSCPLIMRRTSLTDDEARLDTLII